MSRAYRARLALFTLATLGVAISCDENLPSGPNNFNAGVTIVVPRDTIVVGDSITAQAKATDASGRVIQDLKYNWTSADTNILGFASTNTSDSNAMNGRSITYVGKRPGRVSITMVLPDARFVV
ncbi:MAG TPA: hypothetical protein VIP11_17005, partial [Gemmatimonadaceae bacterium]